MAEAYSQPPGSGPRCSTTRSARLRGVTPTGADASNELTELIMEASLRIAMPAPYVSLRLHRDAPERIWEAAASFVIGGSDSSWSRRRGTSTARTPRAFSTGGCP
jgi:hypothetical protein